MHYPPIVKYASMDEYRRHFEDVYCQWPILTFDNIAVRFRKKDFDHCFFESVQAKDDTFSPKRAERIDWIKTALEDPNSERYQGWDKKRKRYDSSRRVTIVMGNYVVVIELIRANTANFVTAYVADTLDEDGKSSTIEKIKKSPKWAR